MDHGQTYIGIESPMNQSIKFVKPERVPNSSMVSIYSVVVPSQPAQSNGKRLWALAKRRVQVIARINAMKRITLQNYYGVRDGNEFEEVEKIN
jgi:hypothetical protein